jgi:hypothetical protein
MAVYYPLSAILTIFCNIIHNPFTPEADRDIDLLLLAPQLIKDIRLRRLVRNEMEHVRNTDHFLTELGRLAKLAVTRAREEET